MWLASDLGAILISQNCMACFAAPGELPRDFASGDRRSKKPGTQCVRVTQFCHDNGFHIRNVSYSQKKLTTGGQANAADHLISDLAEVGAGAEVGGGTDADAGAVVGAGLRAGAAAARGAAIDSLRTISCWSECSLVISSATFR